MPRRCADPHFRIPRIKVPDLEPTTRDRKLGEAMARNLAALILRSQEDDPGRDPCSLPAKAARMLDQMTPDTRKAILRRAGELAGRGGAADSDRMDPRLLKQARAHAKRHLTKMKGDLTAGFKDITAQDRDRFYVIKTWVKMRPPSELAPEPHPYQQTDDRPVIEFVWESEEPGCARAYYEFRGPEVNGTPGRLLARGIVSGRMQENGRVGGFFELDMKDYFPPQPPVPFERYSMRVLPLGAPGGFVEAAAWQPSSITAGMTADEPTPPAGLGPWSARAIIDYGWEFQQPGTDLNSIEEVDYYSSVKTRIDWFKVVADQSGPGDEEYHIRAFTLASNPSQTFNQTTHSAYRAVEEGDDTEFPLGWANYLHNLPSPSANAWPLMLTSVVMVLEEDAGDELDDWVAMVNELASEALEGDLADELSDFVRDLKEELEELREEMQQELALEATRALHAMIGTSMVSFILAFIAFAVAMITIFGLAGRRDDIFDPKVITLILLDTHDKHIHDGSHAVLSGLLSQGDLTGGMQGSRWVSDQIRADIVARSGPDTPALDGIVQVGLHWEFYNKRRA